MRSVFDSETRSVQWHVDVLGIDKVRVSPTVAAVIEAARPAGLGRGDFLVLCALKYALTEPIFRGHLQPVHDALVALGGADAPNEAAATATATRARSGAERPVQEDGNRATAAVSDAEMRRLAGAKRW